MRAAGVGFNNRENPKILFIMVQTKREWRDANLNIHQFTLFLFMVFSFPASVNGWMII
jgi:hypothetical protein